VHDGPAGWALGRSWLRIPDCTPETLERLRARLAPSPCVVLDAPIELREQVDVWGREESPLMRRVRERFDPRGVCQHRGALVVAASRAFDERKPPQLDVIEDCVHCGFCLPTCPTYVLWGEEMDSPRGADRAHAGGTGGGERAVRRDGHAPRSLPRRRSCVTACPSGVRYDRLIEDARAQVERRHDRKPRERALREAISRPSRTPARCVPWCRGWPPRAASA